MRVLPPDIQAGFVGSERTFVELTPIGAVVRSIRRIPAENRPHHEFVTNTR